MFTIFSANGNQDCSGVTRRDFLRVGALGLGGLTLADLLAWRAGATPTERKFVTGKSVVFLFLNGGPSQFETFDPKMTAPVETRSMTGETRTRIPGVTFGGSFPKLAALADRLAVVRSFVPRNASHDAGQKLLSGGSPTRGTLGAVYARLAGNGNPETGLPSNVFVSPQSGGKTDSLPSLKGGGNTGFAGVFQTGSLPTSYAPFHPVAPEAAGATRVGKKGKKVRKGKNASAAEEGLLADMKLNVPADRLDDRRGLLQQLDRLRHGLDRTGAVEGLDRYQQQAYQVILSGLSQVFDLSKEDPKTLARYDTSHMPTPASIANPLAQTRIHSPVALGKQMLLARRLCEAGCGFVTVGCTGWDMHGNNGFGILDGMEVMGSALDHAVSAFLTDVAERGLSDRILLVIAGEMGRTPRITKGPKPTVTLRGQTLHRKGRDHWANLGALVLAGGGLKMGQVVGASDRIGGSPATTPVTLSNLTATILHTLFNVGELRLQRGLPTDLLRLVTDGQPIRELIG
jgi:Protein of unknown function (DUF1501)